MSPDVFAILPDVVWYLTQNGRDMWCRVPYGFFFSSAELPGREEARLPVAAALSFEKRFGRSGGGVCPLDALCL